MKSFIFGLALFFCAFPAMALDRITASLVITNGTTVGELLTVNGNSRLWTNTITLPGGQILTNASPAYAKTNATAAIGVAPFSQVILLDKGVTNFDLVGASGLAMTVTASGYATVSYTTQTVTSLTGVRVPVSAETAGTQTNVASGIVAAINLGAQTNQISQASTAALQLMGTTNDQSVSGIKNFTTRVGGNVGQFAGGSWTNAIFTNATAYGLVSKRIGVNAVASGDGALGYGDGVSASGDFSLAVGANALAAGVGAVAYGSYSHAGGDNTLAVGPTAYASGQNCAAIGSLATATNDNSTAIGYQASTTVNNQVMLGSAGVSVYVNNNATIGGSLNVLGTYTGTNVFAGPVQFIRKANTSLANGNNAAVDLSTNVFLEVSGPSAAFTINGIAGGRDGRLAIVLNQTGQDMTVAHQSGTDPVAANRIISMSGSDRTTTGNGAATLIYSAAASRWILISFDP